MNINLDTVLDHVLSAVAFEPPAITLGGQVYRFKRITFAQAAIFDDVAKRDTREVVEFLRGAFETAPPELDEPDAKAPPAQVREWVQKVSLIFQTLAVAYVQAESLEKKFVLSAQAIRAQISAQSSGPGSPSR